MVVSATSAAVNRHYTSPAPVWRSAFLRQSTAPRRVIAQAATVNPILGQAVGIGLAYTTLAGRDLYDHVQAVTDALAAGDLAGARKAVSMIVGRDGETLSEGEIDARPSKRLPKAVPTESLPRWSTCRSVARRWRWRIRR